MMALSMNPNAMNGTPAATARYPRARELGALTLHRVSCLVSDLAGNCHCHCKQGHAVSLQHRAMMSIHLDAA